MIFLSNTGPRHHASAVQQWRHRPMQRVLKRVVNTSNVHCRQIMMCLEQRENYFSLNPRVFLNNKVKLEGCIDDERQLKTAKRPHGDATVRKRFFRDNFVIFRRRSKRIAYLESVNFSTCYANFQFS